jgi:CRISPR-associated protein Csx10
MRYAIRLETKSPLAISTGRATGNQVQSLAHIPGTVWRGAAAAAYIRQHALNGDAHRNEGFTTLFLKGLVRFGDLRIEGAQPWPLSARICKLNSDVHDPVDLLLAAGLKLAGEAVKLPLECKECEQKLKRPEGHYRAASDRPATETPRTRLTAHTAISNATLTVRHEQFFTTETIEHGQFFRGSLTVEPEAETALREWLGESKLPLILGRGGTRGQGRASVEIEAEDETGQAEELERRLWEFNDAWGRPDEIAFSCTLQSACLVHDQWLCSRPFLEPGDIAEAAGEALDDYQPLARFSRLDALSGWHAAAALPKGDEAAISPGASFLFVRKARNGDREPEIKRLAVLLWKAGQGIGERWEEGLGEAVFCDPFHIQWRLQP